MTEFKTRNDIPKKYKWNLADIFKTSEEWEKEFSFIKSNVKTLGTFKGKLNDKKYLYELLTKQDEIVSRFEKLFVYAFLKRDEDTANSTNKAIASRAEMLAVKLSNECAYISPELTSYSEEYLNSIINDEKFSDYSYGFSELLRKKRHILSDKEEQILSKVGLFADGFTETFTMFDNADVHFDSIKDEKGEEMEITHGMYSVALQNQNQEVRKNAFNSMFTAYKEMINTITANYAGNVKKDWFYSEVRGYKSALERAMDGENVDPIVYKKLIKNVHASFDSMHEYVAYRKTALNLDTLNMYDMYLPIVDGVCLEKSYDEAVEIVKKALLPLGDEYQNILSNAFKSGWVDVYETKGKKSGAYSWGAYGVHPFVCLNYHKTTNDIFTIAHELGHSMHSYYSNANQPFDKCNYEIFVAEIASTVNEVLLLKYLLKNSTDKGLKKYLLSYYMDMFRTTLFRQTMFAEFEKIAHEKVEQDVPITADSLNDSYYKLNKQYYGDSVKHNDLIKYEWARIPHFYRSYYVYKYATGIISAVNIANSILDDSKNVEGYKKFLKAGGSMPPLEILKLANVDLTTDKPYKVAFKEFKDTLEELKNL